MNKGLSSKDLIGLEQLSIAEIELILEQTASFKEVIGRPVKKVPALRGKTVLNLFFENSTRTATSFQLAAQRLSADTVDIRVSESSVKKGESLLDTVHTFEAMNVAVLVVRSSHAGTCSLIARNTRACVINAGDGMHEHPSQGLLDLFTIKEKKGRIKGLQVAIVGDIAHSRVARSDIWGLTKLGAHVRLAGPRTMLPADIEAIAPGQITVTHSLEEALKGADVVQMLRLQTERQARFLFPSTREYTRLYGLNSERMRLAKPDLLVMHPGPMNRGLEISSGVADGPNSGIRDQVTNGVAVRMALLYLLAGSEGAE
ncbi:MAG: aspartate carbamoyltransferase catalytic subunit [candidate division FCPU426 bacterium]